MVVVTEISPEVRAQIIAEETERASRERLEQARSAIRVVEKFALLEVHGAKSEDVEDARVILRLATGLRRNLDSWRNHGA